VHFEGQNKTNKELFLIVKFDEASSAVSPFKHYFLFETSQFILTKYNFTGSEIVPSFREPCD